MGNRVYPRIAGIGIILLLSIVLINPTPAAAQFWPGFPFGSSNSGNHTDGDNNAARGGGSSLIDIRLCERQLKLGNRLSVPLIFPGKCNGTPTSEPTLTLSANPTTVTQGNSSTLTWSSTNATTCTASGGWSGSKNVSGAESVSPSATTTYMLNCTGAGGNISKQVTIGVGTPAPTPEPTLTLTASPTSVTAGSDTTLTWGSTNATSCTASNGWSGSKALSGNQSITVTATTTYALDCSGAGGSVHKEVTVNTTAAPIPSIAFTADPTSIPVNGTSTLTWSTSNVTFCTASNGWTGTKATSGTQAVSPSATSTYALSCGGAFGTTSTSVTVNVTPNPTPNPTPTVTITANPVNVTPGAGSATSTLTWNSTNATFCSASNGWGGSQALSGSQIVEPNATTTYSLACGNSTSTTTESVTVNFIPTPVVPAEGKLLITEVIYDLGDGQGTEPGNEWIELYNGTNSAINLAGYFLHDASSTDPLPAVSLPAGKFAVVSGSSTTQTLWSIPDDAVFILLPNTTIGNGLGNTGDYVWLESNASTTVDAISWGNNISAFNPSVPPVAEGHSLGRINLTTDTDSASDWADKPTPTPGQ